MLSAAHKSVTNHPAPALLPGYWSVLVVDDEQDMHTQTKLAVSGASAFERPIRLQHAHDPVRAKELLSQTRFAVVVINIGADGQGMELAWWLRRQKSNHTSRIILRLAQAGMMPELNTLTEADIDDGKAMMELNPRCLLALLVKAIRHYRHIVAADEAQQQSQSLQNGMRNVLSASARLFELSHFSQLLPEIHKEISAIADVGQDALLLRQCHDAHADAKSGSNTPQGNPRFEAIMGLGTLQQKLAEPLGPELLDLLQRSQHSHDIRYRHGALLCPLPVPHGDSHYLYLPRAEAISDVQQQLIAVFTINAGMALAHFAQEQHVNETQAELLLRLGHVAANQAHHSINHIKRMADYCYELGLLAGMAEPQADILSRAAPMHDIGNIGISDAILQQPDSLSPEARAIMARHTEIGWQLLSGSEQPVLQCAAKICLQHHEKYDGSGYPNGLKGDAICLPARIVAIADAFDALCHKRSYKDAWALEDVQAEMQSCAGSYFDPELMALFIEHIDQFIAIKQRWPEATDTEGMQQ